MVTLLIKIFTIFNLILYIYIVIEASKKIRISKAYRRFFLFILFGFLWVVDVYLEWTVKELRVYEIVVHINYIIAPLVAAMVVGFALHFPNNKKTLSLKKELLILSPLFVISILSFSDYIVKVVVFREVVVKNAGYFYYIGILIIYFIFIAGYFLIQKFKNSTGITRQQLQYICIGYLFAIIILLTQSFISNIFGVLSEKVDLLVTNSSIVFSLSIAYAMFRYRFMDTRVIIRKGIVYGISLITALAIYTYLALLLKNTIEESWNINSTWTMVVLIALVALGFPPLKKLVEKSIDTLFKGRKSIDLAVKELKQKIIKKTDTQELEEIISQQVRNYLDINKAKLYLKNHKEQGFVHPNGEFGRDAIGLNSELIKYIEKNSNVLVREEIEHLLEEVDDKQGRDLLQKSEKEMKKIKASLVVPFTADQEVFGLLVLGERKNKEAYTIQDVKYLEQLREQVSVVLANAIQYQEAMERIHVGIFN